MKQVIASPDDSWQEDRGRNSEDVRESCKCLFGRRLLLHRDILSTLLFSSLSEIFISWVIMGMTSSCELRFLCLSFWWFLPDVQSFACMTPLSFQLKWERKRALSSTSFDLESSRHSLGLQEEGREANTNEIIRVIMMTELEMYMEATHERKKEEWDRSMTRDSLSCQNEWRNREREREESYSPAETRRRRDSNRPPETIINLKAEPVKGEQDTRKVREKNREMQGKI